VSSSRKRGTQGDFAFGHAWPQYAIAKSGSYEEQKSGEYVKCGSSSNPLFLTSALPIFTRFMAKS
jgi:hypothetical protein